MKPCSSFESKTYLSADSAIDFNNEKAWKMTELNRWKKSTVQSAVSSISLVRTSVETASDRNLSSSDLHEMIPSKFKSSVLDFLLDTRLG